jgi:N-methylhydantoinase A
LEIEGNAALDRLGLDVQHMRASRYAEMRYERQEYTIKVRLPDHALSLDELRRLFEETYGRRYGHVSHAMPIDLVMLRIMVDGRTVRPGSTMAGTGGEQRPAGTRQVWFERTGRAACTVLRRPSLPAGFTIAGPAVIEEDASTTVIPPGATATIDASGNIVIELGD